MKFKRLDKHNLKSIIILFQRNIKKELNLWCEMKNRFPFKEKMKYK